MKFTNFTHFPETMVFRFHYPRCYNSDMNNIPSMSDMHLERVRRLCLAFPEVSERLSHGEPTFFVKNKVFVMFANDHHHDGHLAVWLPVPPGVQTAVIESEPEVYFRPPYVGHRGWVGIELPRINDADLAYHINVAWELIASKRLLAVREAK